MFFLTYVAEGQSIDAIKLVKELGGLPLVESKYLVDDICIGRAGRVRKSVSEEEAKHIVEIFREHGHGATYV